jgi:phosphate transport system substrate-binding protein
MKIISRSFLIIALLFSSITFPRSYSQEKSSGQISISGAFALYPMVIKWADEYKKINPGVRFERNGRNWYGLA